MLIYINEGVIMETKLSAKRKVTVFGEKDSLQRLLIYIVIFAIIGFVLMKITNRLAYIGFHIMDDVQIQNLLNGSKGPSDGLCVYLNAVLGSFIAFLYRTFPELNWYGIVMAGMLLLSTSFIAAVLAQRLGGKVGFAVGFAIFPAVYLLTLLNFTYTIIAYFVLSSAFLNIAYSFFIKDKPRKLFLLISAAVFCVVAVMIRESVIVSAVAIGAVYAFFLILRYKKEAVRTVAVIAGVLLLSFAFTAVNSFIYKSTPVWSDFSKFNEVRTDMQDRFYPSYEENRENFEKYGWSQNDHEMFYSHNFPDDPKFSTENLQKIDDSYNSISRYNFSILDILGNIWAYLSDSIVLLVALAVAFYFALTTSKARLLSIAVFIFPFFMQAVFFIIQRALVRVIFPHYVIGLVLLICLIDTQVLKDRFLKKASPKKASALRLTALILVLASTIYPFYDTFSYCLELTEQRQKPDVAELYTRQVLLYDYFYNLENDFFVYAMEPIFYNYNRSQSIFETRPLNYYINSYGLGGWTARSLPYEEFKKRADVQSLPRDLIDNDHVYFVAQDRLDTYTKYFYETYGIPVKYQVCGFVDGFFIMKIKTAQSLDEMGTQYSG